MRFVIGETGDEVVAQERPIVVITSNNEKELPDAFLRRCVFHFIDFPEPELMKRIVRVHHPEIDEALVDQAVVTFYELRELPRIRKRPSTSELIDWIAVLRQAGRRRRALRAGAAVPRRPPQEGAGPGRRRRAPCGPRAALVARTEAAALGRPRGALAGAPQSECDLRRVSHASQCLAVTPIWPFPRAEALPTYAFLGDRRGQGARPRHRRRYHRSRPREPRSSDAAPDRRALARRGRHRRKSPLPPRARARRAAPSGVPLVRASLQGRVRRRARGDHHDGRQGRHQPSVPGRARSRRRGAGSRPSVTRSTAALR